MAPECHVKNTADDGYKSPVRKAKDDGTYIECALSKDDIGNLLQGKSIVISFMNEEYGLAGMIDIMLSAGKTEISVSEKLNNTITGEPV